MQRGASLRQNGTASAHTNNQDVSTPRKKKYCERPPANSTTCLMPAKKNDERFAVHFREERKSDFPPNCARLLLALTRFPSAASSRVCDNAWQSNTRINLQKNREFYALPSTCCAASSPPSMKKNPNRNAAYSLHYPFTWPLC